ncbi:PepSY domain-containing protein [Microbulbifer aggregans]|nr:PepSY domain-containing protein [Microbulbifer aggregans]
MKRTIALALAIAGATLSPLAAADKKPPPGAMALSTVLTTLEQQGYTPIVEVSLDDGRWEIEAFKEGKPVKVKVDPNTAEILSEEPDDS